jgi:ribonuclease HI
MILLIMEFKIYFDGACEPKNPGGALGYGYLIYEDENLILYDSFYEPASRSNTNNVAEYKACLMALQSLSEYIISQGIDRFSTIILGDSKLVVNQMNGDWYVNKGAYVPYAIETAGFLAENFEEYIFKWIPREQNQDADAMSKHELELHLNIPNNNNVMLAASLLT